MVGPKGTAVPPAGRTLPSLMSQCPGAICVVSSDRLTYQQFAVSVAVVEAPAGSVLLWYTTGGGGVARGRNFLVQKAMDAGAHWVWFIDDDHIFAPDTLKRLLKHDVEMCVPAVLERRPPHKLVAFEHYPVPPDATDRNLIELLDKHRRIPKLPFPERGLIEIGAGGTGGMLIDMAVLRDMRKPWFEFGKFGGDSAGEDEWFCLKARRMGVQIWMDLDTKIGHLTTAAVWPDQHMSPRVDFAFHELTGGALRNFLNTMLLGRAR